MTSPSTEAPERDPFYTRKGPIAWMAMNPVAANILMAVIILGGLVMRFQLKEEVFPEFDMEWITIRIPYPGASPAPSAIRSRAHLGVFSRFAERYRRAPR